MSELSSEAEGLSGSWTVHGVPRSHWGCQLENFEWAAARPYPGLHVEVESFLKKVRAGGRPHLLLGGEPGRGKTHLAVGIYRAAVLAYGTWLCAYVNVPAFCDRVKGAYGDGWDPFESYREATRLVVLDDLLGRDYSAHEGGQILYRLIDDAYQNGAAFLLTINHPLGELPKHFRSHEMSRLLDDLTYVHVQGRDWRVR